MRIIPDIGVNWNGDFDLLELMLKACYDAEIDLVKFQAFGPEHYEKYPQWVNLKNSSVTPENIEKINSFCMKYNLEWFATPTNLEAVDYLDQYVKSYKIRYLDQNNTSLIAKIQERKKPIIISCEEPSKFYGMITLYSIPKYPPKKEEIDFMRIKYFNGYSNHYPEYSILLKAALAGAKLIEIHITPGREINVPDNPVSFDLQELQEIQNIFKSL